MIVLFKKIFTLHSTKLLKRSLFLTSAHKSYEGDGKTTVTVLNKNFDYGLMIDNVCEHGFILNNGIRIIGPMIIFPKTMLSWNISSSPDMNEESLSLLLYLEPKLDIVVIGLDDEYPYNASFIQNVKDVFKKRKIPVEVLPTHHASSTYNFLNAENRYAAGALVPPKLKTPESLLLKNSDKKEFLKEQSRSVIDSYAEDSDPLLIPRSFKKENAEIQAKRIEVEETFKIRSPWKSERGIEPPNSSNENDNKS